MERLRAAAHWLLDPAVTFLNHGSFGACPRPVLEAQSAWRHRLERQPVRFFERELESQLDRSRQALAEFVGARPAELVLTPNATTGINTVLRGLQLSPGDELLATDHEYNATLNVLREVCRASGARLVVCRLPFPIGGAHEAVQAIEAAVTPRTRLAVMSHVTSATALVLPIGRIVALLRAKGVETLVDGAHAPGMLPLALDELGAAYYAGNCHKWLCAPKGSGFLHVRRDLAASLRPLVISHGANAGREGRSRLLLEFDWTGTGDPSASLAIPDAIEFIGGLLPGGWPEVMAVNRQLALEARRMLCAALDIAPPAPDELIGSMAALPLSASLEPVAPRPRPGVPPDARFPADPLHDVLRERYAIEVPVYAWPPSPDLGPARRLLRVSAQLYNSPADYRRLADVLLGLARDAGQRAYPFPP